MKLTAIAAVGANGVIGRDQGLPWHLPEDFRRFKQVTMGASLIMGRVTFESIGRPLPGRVSIVVSRREPTPGFSGLPAALDGTPTQVVWVHSLEEALEVAAEADRPAFVAGGARVYEQAWPFLSDLDITEVHAAPVGDAHFPQIDPALWREVSREPHGEFDFVAYQRIGSPEPFPVVPAEPDPESE
ncbi:MAG: dihydrofolate reductase [Propionibacteriaceae bacterium]|jgi:dihydrofolate reductase|nr:dihydrofolate reductase [Propionibacteriaceae bacterium]